MLKVRSGFLAALGMTSIRDKHEELINKAGDRCYFVYDPTAAIPAVVYEQGPQTRYLDVRNPEGVLVSREKYVGENRVSSRTYHFDGNGNTLALSDASGAITDNYTYDTWGNLATHTGPGTLTADNPYQYGGEYGCYTHYQEPGFGFVQTGYRYYDPTSGRYTQMDPIKDGLDWYAYCGGNPMTDVDPWGLELIPGFSYGNDGKDGKYHMSPTLGWKDPKSGADLSIGLVPGGIGANVTLDPPGGNWGFGGGILPRLGKTPVGGLLLDYHPPKSDWHGQLGFGPDSNSQVDYKTPGFEGSLTLTPKGLQGGLNFPERGVGVTITPDGKVHINPSPAKPSKPKDPDDDCK